MKSHKKQFIEKHVKMLESDYRQGYLDDLEQELLEAIEKDDGWINVESGILPEYGEKVLVRGEERGMNPQMGGAYTFITKRIDLRGTPLAKMRERHVDENDFNATYVKYWMKLPNPPINK